MRESARYGYVITAYQGEGDSMKAKTVEQRHDFVSLGDCRWEGEAVLAHLEQSTHDSDVEFSLSFHRIVDGVYESISSPL
jgi:hypothetical protein